MHRTRRFVSAMATLLVFSSLALARQARAGDDWLPVPPEDLALKDNPADPGADAMILYRESILDASKTATRGASDEEYFRIKIFTQAGTKYATVEVPFLSSQSHWFDTEYGAGFKIVGVRGRTIHPDGGIVSFDGKALTREVAKEGEEKYLEATFTLPDVQPGSIIEYKYTKQGEPEWMYSEEWTVSQVIFTREAHFTFVPPADFTGYIPAYRIHGLPADELPKCGTDVNQSCVMTVRNIHAVVEEPLMPPKGVMESYVEWYYEDPGEPLQETTEHFWNREGKTLNDDMEQFIGKEDRLKQEVAQVVGANDSSEVKLRKIYVRAQQIRNLDDEAPRTEKEQKAENLKENSDAADVLNHGYGHDREINILFVGLARSAGFEATEVYITPRNDTFFFPALKYAGQLSDDIVWVRADGKEYFVDPASHAFPFGLLPWFETGAGGIRVTKQGGDMVTTPETVSSDAMLMRHADLDISEDGAGAGKIEVDFMGQEGALLRQEKRNEDETGRKKDLEDEITSWLPAGASFELTAIANWGDTAAPLHVEGTVKVPAFGSAIGRRVIVPVVLFQAEQVKLFAPEKRVNPIYLHFPYEEMDEVNIHTPSGYKIETLPSGQNINKEAVSYEISTSQQTDAVQMKRHLIVKGVMYSKDSYPAFRAFFGQVQTNDNAQIVFHGGESAKSN
jgi:Domain of Unknown Function with PDB structure (DUF3858)/Domain of Unknown Function with PDB structure (DUF3857)